MIIEDADYAALSRAAHEWRERAHGEDATDADREALTAWLAEDIRHEEAYDRAATFWAAYDHLHEEDIDPALMPPRQTLLSMLSAKLKTLAARLQFRIAAAAVLFAAIMAPAFFIVTGLNNPAPVAAEPVVAAYSAGVAQTRIVTLEDGTVATLGALTEIEVSMSDRRRAVALKRGAALFDAAPDPARPFSVKAGDLTATALGTQFDVRNNGGVFRVAVAEGRVEIAYPHLVGGAPSTLMTRRTLNAGQAVAASEERGLRGVKDVPLDEISAWRHQKLIYDGATLGELVADANRYDERDIILSDDAPAIAGQTVTASFDAANIDRMLRMIALSFPVEIDRSDPAAVRISVRQDDGE